MNYRPWGNMQWLLSKLDRQQTWTFWGCISSEDRTRCTFDELQVPDLIKINNYYFTIVNHPFSDESEPIRERIETHKKFVLFQRPAANIQEFNLQYSDYSYIHHYIQSVIAASTGNILLDISCFPKKFFFPIVKFIRDSSAVKNFIVLYTSPARYREGELATDYDEWKTLPFFSDSPDRGKCDTILLSVGHMPMASLDPIEELCASSKLQLYFPFPGNPQSYKRTWQFVYKIRQRAKQENIIMTHTSAFDTSEMYTHLTTDTNIDRNSHQDILIAPYGPKPLSLAMALFASKYDRPVYYTQPRSYYHDYSIGIGDINGHPAITAYSIILNERPLY